MHMQCQHECRQHSALAPQCLNTQLPQTRIEQQRPARASLGSYPTLQAGAFKQSYYNDHHESAMVIKDRLERYIPEMERDELRQPLWVQLTMHEYKALAAATVEGKGELPKGYQYVTRTMPPVPMVELHVDDSDHFDSVRSGHPLGGCFSMRWERRPSTLPAAPPSNLPHPAADTIATVESQAAAGSVAVQAAVPREAALEQPTPAPELVPTRAQTVPLLTNGAINALKVAELREVSADPT